MAVPGLKYWGQVQSSLGQHHAFTGDNAAAVACFDRALAAFAKLSDPDIRAKECEQTGVYRAIAVMDDTGSSDDDVRNAMSTVFGKLDLSTVDEDCDLNDLRRATSLFARRCEPGRHDSRTVFELRKGTEGHLGH